MPKTHRRRFEMRLKLGADDRDEMIREFEEIARQLRQGYLLGESASGGYSSGWSMSVTEDPAVTHDSYIAAIEAEIASSHPHFPPA